MKKTVIILFILAAFAAVSSGVGVPRSSEYPGVSRGYVDRLLASLPTASAIVSHTSATSAHGASGAILGRTTADGLYAALAHTHLFSAMTGSVSLDQLPDLSSLFSTTAAINAAVASHASSTSTHGAVGAILGRTTADGLYSPTGAMTPALTSAMIGTTAMDLSTQGVNTPTWNQDTTGNAANVTGIVSEAHGGTGTNCQPFLPLPTCSSTITSTLTGTTAEQPLFTCTVPANSMGPYGSLYIQGMAAFPNTGNNKTMKVYFGGSLAASKSNLTNAVSRYFQVHIRSAGSTTSQVAPSINVAMQPIWADITQQPVTLSINTAQTTTISLSGTLATPTDTFVYRLLEAWIYRPICP
jgi:hypothetical protein